MQGSSGEIAFVVASDQSLLLKIGETITPEASALVAKLVRRMEQQSVPGVRDINPAYASLLVKFDVLTHSHAEVESGLRAILAQLDSADLPPPREVRIPVLYGGEMGPDLDDVAQLHAVTAADVVRLHAGSEYTVSFLGFVPGFAYLSGLPGEIATPRLASPRKRVPPGSVAIGGNQTGVYPFATPGGWRLIGRTPLRMFQSDRDPASLLAIGDRVRFVPISSDQFSALERSCL